MANDGSADSTVATVTITVNPVNDAPAADDDGYSVNEDATLTVDRAAGVLANDTDVDGDPLTRHAGHGPTHGTLTLNADGSFTLHAGRGLPRHRQLHLHGQRRDGRFERGHGHDHGQPGERCPGAADDSYSVNEDDDADRRCRHRRAGQRQRRGRRRAVGRARVGAQPRHADAQRGRFVQLHAGRRLPRHRLVHLRANDGTADSNVGDGDDHGQSDQRRPVAGDDGYSVDEDDTLTVDAAGGVLSNDSDVDGDTLTATLVSAPSHGS